MQSTNDMQSTDYRLLNVGEVIREGDESPDSDHYWHPSVHVGTRVLDESEIVRRRTTLRDELAELAEMFVRGGTGVIDKQQVVYDYCADQVLRLIAKHWPTQEPQP